MSTRTTRARVCRTAPRRRSTTTRDPEFSSRQCIACDGESTEWELRFCPTCRNTGQITLWNVEGLPG